MQVPDEYNKNKMSKNQSILIRVQSPDGTKRIQINTSESTQKLYETVREIFGLSGYLFALYKERGRKQEIVSSRSKQLSSVGCSHGDLIYMAPVNGGLVHSQPTTNTSSNGFSTASSSNVSTPSTPQAPIVIEEDEVDEILWKKTGKIKRDKDEKLCRHGLNGGCVHCSPLEPFDEAYLKEHNIKHLSFHSYLRKLTAGVDRGKFVSLEPLSCRIKPGCTEHLPWPKGVCSKCTPRAITLNRQSYRHTDNVRVENPQIVERFLDYWRTCGHQRIGYLYGRYEVHADVPLGIRATVSLIYEPPQDSNADSVRLLPDERESIVEELAQAFGLRRVGWIFTDLVQDNSQTGAVKHFRNIKSHFLSAQECIMAGSMQNQHPNPCRFSSSGFYGSKFVTVCVTGDDKNQVHMEGYQVSEQCMSLVRDGCLLPTKDAPELGYVRESTDKKYVPDVFYKEKDSYGNEVSMLARPLPVEYMLVDVPVSTPLKPEYSFPCLPGIRPFPVENRLLDGFVQDLSALAAYLAQFTPSEFLIAASDFHFLLFIATMDIYPMRELMRPLLKAIRNIDSLAAVEWSQSEHWATVEQVMAASSGPSDGSSSDDAHDTSWTCAICTFHNKTDGSSCEMCSLPR